MSVKAESGWYRGDLHLHTGHSNGSCKNQSGREVPCPVFRTVEAAASRGLDFIAITDHNTISHYNSLRELQPYFDRLLLLAGREITTFAGHANVLGTTQFLDFRLTSPSVPNIKALLDQVHGSSDGRLLLLGNPVYVNGASAPGQMSMPD